MMVLHDLHKPSQNQVSMISSVLWRVVPSLAFTSVAVFLLNACGFHLEGLGTLPSAMAITYLESNKSYTDFYSSMRNALRARGSSVVDAPMEAGAVLKILDDSTGQRVLSVSARNTPREYEVFYSITFSLEVGTQSLILPESLVLTRSYTYDETGVLGKSAEESDLRRALADDLARQVLRRIQASQAHAPPI
ncbi:MAG: LPS assembly lipoprotein LptE [Gammaproteobacteria bacterium]